jgi:hypothetical protein
LGDATEYHQFQTIDQYVHKNIKMIFGIAVVLFTRNGSKKGR